MIKALLKYYLGSLANKKNDFSTAIKFHKTALKIQSKLFTNNRDELDFFSIENGIRSTDIEIALAFCYFNTSQTYDAHRHFSNSHNKYMKIKEFYSKLNYTNVSFREEIEYCSQKITIIDEKIKPINENILKNKKTVKNIVAFR